jgi:hypothetical protein
MKVVRYTPRLRRLLKGLCEINGSAKQARCGFYEISRRAPYHSHIVISIFTTGMTAAREIDPRNMKSKGRKIAPFDSLQGRLFGRSKQE